MNKKIYKPKEKEEGRNLAKYLQALVDYKQIKRFTHIPNELPMQNIRYTMSLKGQGKSKGVPDYMILTKTEIVFIELKRRRDPPNKKYPEGKIDKKPTEEQQGWIDDLNSIGIKAKVCNGADEAIDFIESIIKK